MWVFSPPHQYGRFSEPSFSHQIYWQVVAKVCPKCVMVNLSLKRQSQIKRFQSSHDSKTAACFGSLFQLSPGRASPQGIGILMLSPIVRTIKLPSLKLLFEISYERGYLQYKANLPWVTWCPSPRARGSFMLCALLPWDTHYQDWMRHLLWFLFINHWKNAFGKETDKSVIL